MMFPSVNSNKMGSWFPFNYRDVAGWKSECGIDISTTSDEAAKLFDATVAQTVLMDTDKQIGGVSQSSKKMMEADPDFLMGRVFCLVSEIYGGTYSNPDQRKKVFELKKSSEKRKISNWERSHIEALCHTSNDNNYAACNVYEDILAEYPGDMLAGHLAYFGHLHSGRVRGLRDPMYRMATNMKSADRYYGNVWGKLCLGFGENCQFVQAEAAGKKALEHTPRDIWAIHSMAHVHEETERPNKGLSFLEGCEHNWRENGSLRTHVAWHRTLYHVQLGEYEAALTQFDDVIMPLVRKGPMPFPLSDASSLLLRLQMFNEDLQKGELRERWRELGQMYTEFADGINTVFYDANAVIGLVFGEEEAAAGKLVEAIREQARMHTEEKTESFNHMRAHRFGIALAEGITAFAREDYGEAVDLVYPVRYDYRDLCGASHAQRDVIELLLLVAAIRAGRHRLAKGLLDERNARGGEVEGEGGEGGAAMLNQRLMDRIAQINSTSVPHDTLRI